MLACYPIIAFILLTGGFGLAVVETSQWGGLLLTLVIAGVGMTAALPLGGIAGAGPALAVAGDSNPVRHVHRVLARRPADYRAVHVLGDAAAVPAR
jgi:hypothetical protein